MKALQIISLSVLVTLVAHQESSAQSDNCMTVMSASTPSMTLLKPAVNKIDTLQISVNCLPDKCRLDARVDGVQLKAVGSNRFILKPSREGEIEIKVYSLCPPHTTVQLASRSMDVAGRMAIGSLYFTVSK